MKARIIIEYEGKFTEKNLQEEVVILEQEIENSLEMADEPKFNTAKVSYKILK